MAKTNWQDPKSSEIRSTHISGLQEAVGKLEESIGLETVAETDIPLTEVFISNDDRCRIYQAPEGKRNWLISPAPVIKKNGVVITDDFEIDYGGGAVIFTTPISESDIVTADATYTKKIDDKQLEILSNKIDNLAGEGRTTETVKGNADKIGNLSNLKTNAKSDLVNAINEVKDNIDDISLEAENVSYNNTDSGLEASNVQAAIDEVKDELDEHKVEIIQKTGWVDPIEFGCVGDGVADDTVPLQNAINYAQENKIPLRDNGNHIFNISSPLYVSDNLNADFNYSVIRKTTNTKGIGSYTSTSRGVTYTFEVDAIIIGKKNGTIYENHLKNINFESTAPDRHEYGVYMPLLAKSTMENFLFQWGKFDYGVYGYVWWLIPKFNNIRLDDGIATWRIADDGSGLGGSTSINATMIIGTEQPSALQLYGVSYSVINIPLIDNNQPKTDSYAFDFLMCEGITVNSPSAEVLRTGKFLSAVGSRLVINTPRAYYIQGASTGEVYLILAATGSSVTINNGLFKDYETGNPNNNFPLMVLGNSHVILNNTRLPNNANQYRGLTENSTLIVNDSEMGITFQSSGGVIDKNNGKRTFLRDDLPTEGDFVAGDKVILYRSDYTGRPMEYTCVLSGNPGRWRLTKQGGVASGPSQSRPSALTEFDVGLEYYDTTLNKFIKWNGTAWIDWEGNTV